MSALRRSLGSRRSFSIGLAVALLGTAAAAASVAITPSTPSTPSAGVALSHAVGAKSRPCSKRPVRRWYVSVSGSNGSSGTLRHPWRTIARALRTAGPGDAVYVRSGTYPEWVRATRSGTAARPISLRAYPGEQPVITGRLKIEDAYFCVSGFRFEGRTPANNEGVMIYVSGAEHVEIWRNQIVNAFMSGVYVGDEGDVARDVSFVGNDIRGNGTHEQLDHGLYLGHLSGGLIANNIVLNNRAIGVKVAPEASDVLVTQNTVVSNRLAGIAVGGDLSWASNDNVVANNIVAFNGSWGIRTYWERKVGSRNLAIRNLVYRNRDGSYWFPGGGMSAKRSIRADPRFAGASNYRLRAGSPALNRAMPAFSMRSDINGRTRSRGHADLGAFER